MLGPRWRERQGRPQDTEVPPEPANDLAPVSRPLYLPSAHDPPNEDVPDMRTLHLQPLLAWEEDIGEAMRRMREFVEQVEGT